jgi:hypothetical protein
MEFTNCDICDKNQATHEIAWGGVRCDECREKAEGITQPNDLPCMVPPFGWICTRESGHEGPCAAVFVEYQAAEQIERFKAAIKKSK